MLRTLWQHTSGRLTTSQSRRSALSLVAASMMGGATTAEAGKKKKGKHKKKKGGSGCGVVFEACCPDHTCQGDGECHTDTNVCFPPIPNL